MSSHPQQFDRVSPLPRPTFAPASLAFGVMWLAWGLLTHWIMSLAGACIVASALYAWINEIRHEADESQEVHDD